MKKILITGANSFIGTSYENFVKEKYPDEFEINSVSLRDDNWRSFDFGGYDAILHVAGIAHQKETEENADSYYKINRDLAVDVAKKAKEEGVKQFVFLSSMSVYGLITGSVAADTVPAPKSNYGKSKLEAERALNALSDEDFKICIVRPPMIYGKGCKGNYNSLRKFALKTKLFPYVKNSRSMLYIDNLCEFLRLVIENAEEGVFLPQNTQYTNTSEMVKLIAEAHGKKLRLVHGFGWAVRLLCFFSGTAKKAFGSLTYDKTASAYKEDYNTVDLIDSVINTEQEQ